MSTDNLPLILDLVGWVAAVPRTYAETMDAWRTSCPRLTIWEDAVERGYVQRATANGVTVVHVTPAGRALLVQHGRHGSAAPLAHAAE